MNKVILSLAVLLITGCGELGSRNDDNKDSRKGIPTKHAVAVIDSGFDIENAVFEGRLIKAYDVRCQETKHPFEQLSGATRYAELKRNFLDYLELRKGCTIDKKLNNEISSEFASIAGGFNQWNSAVKGGLVSSFADREKVQRILTGENGKFNYHGTATAGLIAEDNPKVELYIVSLNLARVIMYNDIYNNHSCRSQAEIDLKAQLFEDEEVRQAYTNPLRDDADSLIHRTLRDHGVTMINESYGPASLAEFNDFYRRNNCQSVDFKRMIVAESNLARDRERALEERYNFRPLHIKASGNASKELNLISDTLDPCVDDDLYLMVGALDRHDKIAAFSNTGRCVEVYALGEQVIVQRPRDFLDVSDGTSYSAPLLTRYLTLHTTPGTSPEDLKSFVFEKRDIDLFIKSGDWNRSFAYVPRNDATPVANNNRTNNGYLEGWSDEIIAAEIANCTQEAGGVAYQPRCDCLIKGLAQKYTYQQVAELGDGINGEPLVQQCLAAHPIEG